jgi:hypothetical protein
MPRPSEVDLEELLEEGDESAHSRLISHAELEPPADPEARAQFESRRLGLRTAASFTVFVTSSGRRFRARAAEISTTGVLVDFRHSEAADDFDGLVTLELAVPALPRPIRCAARLARHVGRLRAFEFMIIGRDERLNLAEYIDRVARHAQN